MALTQTTDTCTDNHCTWSPIISYKKGVSFTEGNMRSTTTTSSGDVGGLIGSMNYQQQVSIIGNGLQIL